MGGLEKHQTALKWPDPAVQSNTYSNTAALHSYAALRSPIL